MLKNDNQFQHITIIKEESYGSFVECCEALMAGPSGRIPFERIRREVIVLDEGNAPSFRGAIWCQWKNYSLVYTEEIGGDDVEANDGEWDVEDFVLYELS